MLENNALLWVCLLWFIFIHHKGILQYVDAMTCKNYEKGNQFYSTLSVESVHLMQTELPSMIVMSEKKIPA